jgi:MOSC domain-containing protein YiiM
LAIAEIVSVSARSGHGFGKDLCAEIMLVEGEGVLGDAHCGVKVKHRSRVAKDANQPNLRQVHLIHGELLDELAMRGFVVKPGELGENILTRGVDLLGLSEGTELRFHSGATVRITGLRNPCHQINGHTPGLMESLLDHAQDGTLIRKGGVMGVVVVSGAVRSGEECFVIEAKGAHIPLRPV